MALDTYRRKRNFDATPEPRGRAARRIGHSYLIQKHAARRLHYDLRLELDGVLKSWAVTRGPSLVPGEKRLAVEVEDHPLDYGSFEGTIPKGEYGGGTVLLWDTGSWEPIGDPHKGLKKGHLEFRIDGEKLHGRWHLVRMPRKAGESRDNWLLIKSEDEAARDAGAPDILEERPESVKTGRDLDAIAREAPGWSSRTGRLKPDPPADPALASAKAQARKTGGKMAGGKTAGAKTAASGAGRKSAAAVPLPDFVAPALATLAAKAPVGAGWVHEIKFDGYRLEARLDHGEVRLLTRSGLDWTGRFGAELVAALARLPAETALIDGEVVVETGSGASSFSALQQDLSEGRSDRMRFYAFDLLHLDGRDLTADPLIARKAALQELLARAGGDGSLPLRFSEHFEEDGATMLRHACRLSLEGLVSKRRDGRYRSGRSKDWLKSKCAARQEFVIGGYVRSSVSARAIGSLVLGVFENGRLRHVGRVGTGYSARMAEELFRLLQPLIRDGSPFADRLTAEEKRGAVFVEPSLVAEVEFRGWTGEQHLRHASYRGLRDDKPAAEVVREEADPGSKAGGGKPDGGKPMADRSMPASKVTLTHPDRLYWPEDGVTKQGLADYYAQIWRFIAPFVVARPLALLRCPDGIAKACFFQKHAWRGINKAIRQVSDPKDKGGDSLLSIRDLDGLIALVQAGTLEIHPWGAPLGGLEKPDMLIFDLDPGDGVGWPQMVAAARAVRDRLQADGLTALVKTSGGKGLHVVVPLAPKAGWPAAKAYAKALADAMAAEQPDDFISVATKARRNGRIFIDYLRNARGATAVAPYSSRARPGAAVSLPVGWEELDQLTGAAQFTIANAPTRLAERTADPWEDFRAAAVPLPAGKRKS
ncbi:bifunctional non-homologous end joining protein LigD [Ancylobacter sp. 3268]|uniref:DNA ligase D n=1 Tax=Ancylobacter sp. 3268 TaxID=2817752 RepID=UPI00285F4869|nr:DNA ligase D [Ancylobacter sp. 3268]MDR6951334.1 bifunctional non-homologous end joining protein LigD [Ancylobacter sp. 3268]